MTMHGTEPDEPAVALPQLSPCRHLRSAGMYLYPDRTDDETAENYDSSAYWCFHTMKSFGPNDDMVGGRECRDPSRACYEPI
jgi:hypothetical protein